MKVQEIGAILDGEFLCGGEWAENMDVDFGYAADLMSDVLAFARAGSMLITGLTNIQIVRTAQMMDIPAVVFVRGKRPQEDTVRLAAQSRIPLLVTMKSMYETSGVLFAAGLPACIIPHREAGGEEH